MDIVLHGDLSGIDITQIINENHHIPVVYVTAYTDEVTLEKINSTKHSGILPKPFEAFQLKQAIIDALK